MRETMLILHFIGLSMGLGVSFSHAFLGKETATMSPEETTKFRLHTLALTRMGHIGLGLLIISGLYLIIPYWRTLPSNPLLIAKLTLVITLAVLISIITVLGKKAKKGDANLHLNKMATLGKFTLLIALTIVVLAVSIFH